MGYTGVLVLLKVEEDCTRCGCTQLQPLNTKTFQ